MKLALKHNLWFHFVHVVLPTLAQQELPLCISLLFKICDVKGKKKPRGCCECCSFDVNYALMVSYFMLRKSSIRLLSKCCTEFSME